MISVIMPAYNSEAFIVEAVESILNQTFQDFELIISDDGSSDRTLEIARSYAAKDPRVKVIQADHVGAAENGNRCLRAAKYPWVARMDSDDISLPDRLAVLAEAVRANPEVVLWGAWAGLIDRWSRRMRQVRLGPETQQDYLDARKDGRVILVVSPTCMFRRDLALDLGGYDDRMDGADDVELMNSLAELGPVRVIPREIALYRLHGGSVSATRFLRQHRVLQYLHQRNLARLRGSDLTIEEFWRDLEAQPLSRRMARYLDDKGRIHYRNTIMHLAEHRFAKAIWSAGMAAVCNPSHMMRRAGRRLASH
ncbi:glycosyltransferase family 2 protein [Skermanella stibiiresistens]|uniref:glycosyltransferase family 2 protein n=1 Tax=Skermanella stibiiresistens TaxID=913326 RepID=UPI0018DB7460|nr:glycosyltransferase family 2 protein [Skermanella stibiiresistens]